MKVKVAAKAGFCFGVKRALDMAERTVETSSAVSLGPLIHNQQVVKRLAERGIRVVNALEEVLAEQALIIRSHGVGPSVYQGAENKGIQVVDATCPFVQKAQRLAAESAQMGQQVIVMGDKLHPEVQGILGWAGKHAIPIQTLEEAKELPFYPQLAVLAQTTQLAESFEGIVEELKLHTDDLTVHNTICNATAERQKAARELAQTVDVMVVVGGRNSANTQKLASICAELTKTYLIETAEELEVDWFNEATSAGLTAGASTPDWIIEEVYQKMSEMNENEMDMANWLESFQDLHLGARVTGKVVKITNDEIFVDIGWKSEGIIPFVDEKGVRQTLSEDLLSIGDEITAVVIRVENEEGHTVLSKRQADEEKAQERLEKFAESKEEIQAKVVEVVKGGLLVDVGLRGFVPASQLQLGYVEDLKQFLGQTLRLRIIEFDPAKRKVVLSQKIILEEEQAIKRRHLLDTLKVGDIVTGVVQRIADFGAFVDIGGIDGLLHVSEMTYARIQHPSEILKTGDVVEVQVLKFEKQTGKLSLGLKQLKVSPWVQVAEKYPVGSLVEGVVVRIVSFGAFVGLADGVDGLVHISQLADHRVNKVEEVLKVGDMVSAKVIECKPEEKRISLSMREMVKDAARASDVEAMASQPEIKPVTIGDVLGKIILTDKQAD
ncbi:MAG TPA: bifunctional 4-hydroxy-3-methylbut-2-enyl diphosphate reductase/30S ribosomal protein S1 [Desulfosporosinus sp.]|nr:bifunctional 4-hydroxy-3-methylbut-2-enyl diphosphate reductase/30S ribosomal protein S1 [Desulfosporosinus sp.]